MANHAEIRRYIDSIARDKEIDKEALILGIEQAMSHALAKKYGVDDVEMMLDRETGEFVCNYEVSMQEQGRIFAMSVKQAIISRVREAERDVIYTEYEAKLGEIVSGNIQRFEGDTVIVNLGRNLEGILPRSEEVRSEKDRLLTRSLNTSSMNTHSAPTLLRNVYDDAPLPTCRARGISKT